MLAHLPKHGHSFIPHPPLNQNSRTLAVVGLDYHLAVVWYSLDQQALVHALYRHWFMHCTRL